MQTNMLHNAAIAALLTTASAVSTFAADYAPFARVEATYTDSGYSDAPRLNFYHGQPPTGYAGGAGLSFGVIWKSTHEFMVSSGYTKWSGDSYGTPGISMVAFDSEQVPLLLGYRYRVKLLEKFTLSAGPTVGAIFETATINVTQNSGLIGGLRPVGSYSDEAWKPAFGGTVGLSYEVSDRWSVDASIQVLRVNGTKYDLFDTAGSEVRYETATRVQFALGASYRW